MESASKDKYEDDTESEGENPIIADVIANSKKTKEKPTKPGKCIFDDGIITCEKAPLPASDFCHQHVLKVSVECVNYCALLVQIYNGFS